MNDPKETYRELIIRHLAKELSHAESEQLLEWVKESPQNQELFDQVQDIWIYSSYMQSSFEPNVDAAWAKVKHKISPGQTLNVEKKKTRLISLVPDSFLRIAASVFVAFGLAFLIKMYMDSQPMYLQLSTTTKRGLFVLPDSSKVWLNPHSTLSYEKHFRENQRKVELNGEAFFEVKRNEAKPFLVIGQKTRVEVLGTSFLVHARPGDEKEYVVVATGKVQFSESKNEQNKVVMTAGDEAVFSPTKPIQHKVKSSTNATAWKTNRLHFDNTSLKEVLNDLQLYFNTRIEVEDEAMLNCRFTGDFESPTLDGVLEIVAVSLNSTYKKQESYYMLYGVGCP